MNCAKSHIKDTRENRLLRAKPNEIDRHDLLRFVRTAELKNFQAAARKLQFIPVNKHMTWSIRDLSLDFQCDAVVGIADAL